MTSDRAPAYGPSLNRQLLVNAHRGALGDRIIHQLLHLLREAWHAHRAAVDLSRRAQSWRLLATNICCELVLLTMCTALRRSRERLSVHDTR